MFNSNSLIYNFASENELAVVLGHFSKDYITTIVQTNLENRLRIYNGKIPNAIYSIEQDFKATKENYPDSITDIEYCRASTYQGVISQLCNFYDLEFNLSDNVDLYSCTFTLYNLLVSDFADNLILFFTNYIIKERNALYDYLNLSEYKKNKDSSTLYSKKIYKNNKLAAIHANLERVVDSIAGFDISFETLLNIIYTDKNLINFILSIVKPRSDFFRNHFASYLFTEHRPVILTTIRLRLQELATENINVNNI